LITGNTYPFNKDKIIEQRSKTVLTFTIDAKGADFYAILSTK